MAHTLQGIVTSDKRDKTITVSIASRETHPLYRKQYTHTRKYTAHDENNEAKLGDRVEKGDVLAYIHSNSKEKSAQAAERFLKAYEISENKPGNIRTVYAKIDKDGTLIY